MPELRVELDDKDLKKLQDYFYKMPKTYEDKVNRFMHNYKTTVAEDIKQSIPTSRYHRDGRHANKSDSMQEGDLFMGFYVKTRPARTIKNWREYGYLIFPELGRGYTNPAKQAFFHNAGEKHKPIVVDKIITMLQEVLNKK